MKSSYAEPIAQTKSECYAIFFTFQTKSLMKAAATFALENDEHVTKPRFQKLPLI